MVRGIAVLAVSVCAACASAETPTLVSRFVRQGTPTVDLGGPQPTADGWSPAPAPLAHLAITADVSRVSAGMSSLESLDPELRAALAKLTIAPTTTHYLGVARAYRRLGIMDQAYDYLTRSLSRNGPDSAVYDARARVWRDWGHPEIGLADSHRAVFQSPQSASARNTLGTMLYRLGQRAGAEAQFRQVLAIEPDAWYAWANLCHVSLAQGRTRDAIAQCRQATTLRGKQPRATKAREKVRP